jgi:hypothetical protein
LKSFHLELHNLAGLCGSLQYAAVHSRPDIATKVASLQKGITTATVETLMEGNKVLKEAQTYAHTSVSKTTISSTRTVYNGLYPHACKTRDLRVFTDSMAL